jgi:hypothetical protein
MVKLVTADFDRRNVVKPDQNFTDSFRPASQREKLGRGRLGSSKLPRRRLRRHYRRCNAHLAATSEEVVEIRSGTPQSRE